MNKLIRIILLFTILLIVISCNEKPKTENQEVVETMNSGKLHIAIDKSIYPFIDTALKLYNVVYPNVKLTVDTVESRKAMSLLLSGSLRAVVIARDYLKDEDSLMKIYKVTKHKKIELAQDAIVFFANKDFPLDTITDKQLESLLTEKEKKFKDYYPKLQFEPKFISNSVNSSEWANLNTLVAKGKKITKAITFTGSADSVKQMVSSSKDNIGISYLSHLAKDNNFKIIKVSFVNEKGKYEPPQIVHQAFLVQKRYPYIFSYWAYLLEDRMNLPYWFASFLGKEAKVQTYFKDIGIVPAFAKIVIIKED